MGYSLAVYEPLEYARLYLEGNLQMWVDAEDSLELYNASSLYASLHTGCFQIYYN